MALSERTAFDSITILEDGQINLRRARIIFDDDGVTELSRVFHRRVLLPGDDITGLPNRIQAICNLVWTPQIIAAWKAAHPE